MRYFIFVLLAVALQGVANAEFRIGVVNPERVMRESAPAVRATKKLEKEFERREQELQKTGKSLQTLQDYLEKNSVTLPEAERRVKEREFADMNREFQRKQREFREDRTQRQNEELSGVLDRANRTIKQIAESEHFDLILQEAVYFSPAIDITDKVIKAMADPK